MLTHAPPFEPESGPLSGVFSMGFHSCEVRGTKRDRSSTARLGYAVCVVRGEYLWNLDRIDELSYANRDGTYNMCPEARSTQAYVLDYGIYAHSEFESRIIDSRDFSGPATGQADYSNGCYGSYVPNSTHVLADTHSCVMSSSRRFWFRRDFRGSGTQP
jgi:hypothetical protein